MTRIALDIELLEDVVLPMHAASSGAQSTLDTIPGAVLLGVAARKLYAQLAPAEAFTLFHSGAISFGTALPLHGAEVAWPMPRCWDHQKDAEDWRLDSEPARLNADRIYSRLHEIPENLQTKALREHYVTESGVHVKVRRTLRLRTAINPETGLAADAQLFGYEAIEAGQRFRAVLSASAPQHAALLEMAAVALCGIAYLGRSRSAEHGRVQICRVDEQPWPRTGKDSQRLHLWLLSDLCLIDDVHGQPTLMPDAQALGLSGGELLSSHSFIGVRRYSAWNAKRNGRDSERYVIRGGSVLCLDHVPTLDEMTLTRLRHGIGLHREHGLGRIAVQPALLDAGHPQFAAPASEPAQAATVPDSMSEYEQGLLAWLSAVDDAERSGRKAEADAVALFRKWRKQLDKASYFAAGTQPVGPSSSQWGGVRDIASQYDGVGLRRALFEGDGAACKPTARGWGDTTDGNRSTESSTLSAWFRKALGEAPDARMVSAFVREAQRFAHKDGHPEAMS